MHLWRLSGGGGQCFLDVRNALERMLVFLAGDISQTRGRSAESYVVYWNVYICKWLFSIVIDKYQGYFTLKKVEKSLQHQLFRKRKEVIFGVWQGATAAKKVIETVNQDDSSDY